MFNDATKKLKKKNKERGKIMRINSRVNQISYYNENSISAMCRVSAGIGYLPKNLNLVSSLCKVVHTHLLIIGGHVYCHDMHINAEETSM